MLETHMICACLQLPAAWGSVILSIRADHCWAGAGEYGCSAILKDSCCFGLFFIWKALVWSRDLKFARGMGFVSGTCYLLSQPNILKFSQVAGFKKRSLSLVRVSLRSQCLTSRQLCPSWGWAGASLRWRPGLLRNGRERGSWIED